MKSTSHTRCVTTSVWATMPRLVTLWSGRERGTVAATSAAMECAVSSISSVRVVAGQKRRKFHLEILLTTLLSRDL